VSPTTTELLFEVLNVGLLAVGLAYLLFKPVRAALADDVRQHTERETALVDREAEAEATRAELAERQAALDADLQRQAARIIDAANEEARRAKEASVAELEARRATWESELATRVAEGVHAEARAAAGVAAEAVRGLLTRAHGPELDLALARTALDTLPSSDTGPVTVELAAAPSDALQALLDERLPPGFAVRVRPELGAGLRVLSHAGLVDVTAVGLAADAARALADELSAQADEADTADEPDTADEAPGG
jgi:hypothetical protein